ncbi:tyrocidine synthase 3 [Kordia sp. SMS9]|uniref:non-ribosomal peptide synthetase n=1 Tax=Kordia sp. SMS9 TaxID=2282170 RepID=UPI000E0D8FBC|nr:non-ribosomal peptide synthetase [Kordia sp. SMS9]AXG70687.1 tyrocidine synthase 3 [Kordia sp. SMS9]
MKLLFSKLNELGVRLKVEQKELKIKAPKGVLTKAIIAEIKAHKSDLIALLSNSDTQISKTEYQESYPLTSAQKRMWILHQMQGNSAAYTIPIAFEITGIIDLEKLEKAFQYIIHRHESLRTYFTQKENQEIQQCILPQNDSIFKLEVITTNEESAIEAIEAHNKYSFLLEKAPLWKAKVFRLSENRHIISLIMHHIISDGWSMEIFIKDLLFAYDCLQHKKTIDLPELSIQYKDYTVWNIEERLKPAYTEARNYWKQKFSGELPIVSWPGFKTRPKIKTFHGNTYTHNFSEAFTEKIEAFAVKEDCSLFMLLMTAINILCYKYTNTTDTIIGTPIANRDRTELEAQIGLYLNTLAIRTSFEATKTIRELLAIQKHTLLEAYTHQAYPFDELVDALSLERDVSRSPLFDVMVVLHSQQNIANKTENRLKGLDLKPYLKLAAKTSRFDYTYAFFRGEKLQLKLTYNTDIYEALHVQQLCQHLENILEEIVTNPQQKINEINYLSTAETKLLLEDFTATKIDYNQQETILNLFEEQVVKTPNAIAIVFEDKTIDYKTLNATANQLANYLDTTYQLELNDLVGIKLVRNEWMLISMLAVLKTGAAYVPIDPNYPEDRVTYIESHSQCTLTITFEELQKFKTNQEKYAAKNLEKVIDANSLAYVIYTSGSTGKPKGVMITHKNATSFLQWAAHEFDLSTFETVYATTSFCFDLSIFEIFFTLTVGKKIRLLQDALEIKTYVDTDKKVLLNTVPSVIKKIPEITHDNIRVINVAGEEFPIDEHFLSLAKKKEIRNLYGPSEDTTYSTCYRIQGTEKTNVSIGKPIANGHVYILSETMKVQPIGVSGELCVSGAGLSKGYLHNDTLTAEKFIPHPFIKGELLYKTGDLAKWLPDGNIAFLGRKDRQVKIRGYRIELGEIENVLTSFSDDISEVVLMVKKVQKYKVLVAYFTTKNDIEKTELKEYLASKLPEYMVPSHYVSLSQMPLTPNGKIDRKSLPEITGESIIRNRYIAPKTPKEKAIVRIWQSILGIEKIGVTDNFFELGGNSLMVSQVINIMSKELNQEVSFVDFFSAPIIKELALLLKQQNYIEIPRVEEAVSYPVSSSQYRLWILSQFAEGSIAYNMPMVLKLLGKLDHKTLELAFHKVIARHEILRTNFKRDASGEVRQYISDEIPFQINYVDCCNTADQKTKVASYLDTDYQTAFNLEKNPLLRATLIKTETAEHIFLVTMHHIISDGWSQEILISEIITLYNSIISGEEIVLPALPIQNKDYVSWLKKTSKTQLYKESETYWLQQFQGTLPVLDLPSFKSRPKVQTFHGSVKSHQYSEAFLQSLKTFSKSNNASLFMTLMAGINALLHRYTHQNDIILGTPIAGREHPDLEGQIGLFVNTLAIRTQIENNQSFSSLIHTQKNNLLNAYEHQNYPLDELVTKLNLQRDTSRSALFDVMVILQNQEQLQNIGSNNHLNDIIVESYPISNRTSKFDMSFVFSELNDKLTLEIEYNTDIYDDYFVDKIFSHFEKLLTQLIAIPSQSITSVNYLSDAETHELLQTFNATANTKYPSEKTIVELFETQVEKTPTNTALVYEEKELTYQEINQEANQFANYLIDKHQVHAGNIIGIQLERSEISIIVMLGILKASCSCSPIAIDIPQEKFQEISKNAKLVVNAQFFDDFKNTQARFSKVNLDKKSSVNDVAYIIYTSGSTGKPKGCMIQTKGIVNHIYSKINLLNMTTDSVISHTSKLHFVGSIWQIWTPLILGGKLILNTLAEIQNIALLLEKIKKEKVKNLEVIPSQLNNVFAIGEASKLKVLDKLILTGERLSKKYVNRFFDINKNIEIINTYGQTECSDVTTFYQIPEKIQENTILVGQPIQNMQNYILDANNALVPVGVIGEIHTSGIGVSRGYINQEELTNISFIKNSFDTKNKLYKTGDLGKMLPNGLIEVLGRKDNQVKIRGYRINIGEIENAFRKHDEIKDVVILSKINELEEQELMAYITSSKELKATDLHAFLRKYLSDYMLPTSIMQLAEFPLLPNGKVDKNALLTIKNEEIALGEHYVAPKSNIEKSLVAIWENILEKKQIGIKDDFFALGGHSIKAVRILFEIKKEFNIEINIVKIFESPTIENLAAEISFIQYQENLESKKTTLKEIEL